jgi:hypothetical protein
LVKTLFISISLLYLIQSSCAQNDSATIHAINKKRLWFVTGANVAFYTGSFIALNKAWYADYPKTKFHFFNDNAEWNQVDKAGHFWTTYQVSRYSGEMWEWTGLDRKKSVLLGGVSGMVYQSIIEIQDAYSSEWGFSWGDVAANTAGAGLYVAQELFNGEQRLQLKLSYYPYHYPANLKSRRNDLFGKSLAERVLKDYNSQVYWLSANLHSFFPDAHLPKWLNVAVGNGAEGMYGGRTNRWTDKEGVEHDLTGIKRVRKFYLSPDVDLTKIPVHSKLLRSVFFVLNAIKIPAPAAELKDGKIRLKIK